MTEQEHEQQSEETPESEETIKDLDVPEEEGKDVSGGQKWSTDAADKV
jgi:hypothetical protein